MHTPRRQWWLTIAILIGFFYSAIGVLFALPASQVRLWRLAAWLLSALAFSCHIIYERLRERNSALTASFHVVVAVAIGAFGLALAANVHEWYTATTYRRSLGVALIAWPLLTSVPAFIAALVISYSLTLLRRG